VASCGDRRLLEDAHLEKINSLSIRPMKTVCYAKVRWQAWREALSNFGCKISPPYSTAWGWRVLRATSLRECPHRRRAAYSTGAQCLRRCESDDCAKTADQQTFTRRASKLQKQTFNTLPDGIAQPQNVATVSMPFVRDPKVRARVLK
jgi:hypothetical protein